MPKYSVIIPVYNRPQEVDELLFSLTKVNYNNFEVIIVEDGSEYSSENVCNKYKSKLSIVYKYQENKGPGGARNTGAAMAKGEIYVFFDSDCIIPPDYFNEVDKHIDTTDCYGGSDRAHKDFNAIQKAINYSMTSTLTTGGIRGGDKKLDKFYPRSFNLGIKAKTFHELSGFSDLRFGEDLDFSMRILKSGNKSLLIKDAWVYHKRRNNLKSFFKQVHNSGIARINLSYRHPGTLKLVHCFPALFTASYFFTMLIAIFFPFMAIFSAIPLATFFLDSFIKTKQLKVSFIAVASSMVMIFGYGTGFIKAFIKRKILKQAEFTAYANNFYK